MNDATDNNGTFDYMWSHAMISDETYQGLMKYCTTPNFNRTKCNLMQFAVDEEVGAIDFYNIYGPVCSHSRTNVSKKTKCAQDYDPCELSYVRNYLNLPQVQEVLHANGTNIPYAWDACRLDLNSCIFEPLCTYKPCRCYNVCVDNFLDIIMSVKWFISTGRIARPACFRYIKASFLLVSEYLYTG